MKNLLLVCALLFAGTAGADDYPSKSIRLIVPFTAGGALDTVARLLSEPMTKGLGKTVVAMRGGTPVMLGEVADVREAPAIRATEGRRGSRRWVTRKGCSSTSRTGGCC